MARRCCEFRNGEKKRGWTRLAASHKLPQQNVAMRLITFENSLQQRRVGAIAPGDRVVDLSLAHAAQHGGKRSALVPSDMRLLFEGGDRSLHAAREALAYAVAEGEALRGPAGEPV